MEKRIVTIFERAMTTTVNDIEHMESQSVGVSVIKVYFHPASRSNWRWRRSPRSRSRCCDHPPGIPPPLIIRYSASSVPILQPRCKQALGTKLYDLANNFIRTQLATIQGASYRYHTAASPARSWWISIPGAPGQGLSALDVVTRSMQNLIVPGGTAKIGAREYRVHLNSSPARSTI